MGASFTGTFDRLRRLRRNVVELANAGGQPQRQIAKEAQKDVKQLLREQFAEGRGPDDPWERTADGEPALVSKKLPSDFEAQIRPGGLLRVQPSRATWLRAHHEGHVFTTRQGGGQVLTFNKSGRLVKRARISRQKFVFDRVARKHTVGRRVLKPRPIYPNDIAASPRWSTRIRAGQARAMKAWAALAAK